MTGTNFTPALGHASLTPLYDFAIRLLTRERRWRQLLLEQVAPRSGERIIDVGCGTGTFAIQMALSAPGVRITGLDPDPAVLQRARSKAAAAGVDIEWLCGVASEAGNFAGSFDKAVSSLLFHQVALEEKAAGIAAMLQAVKPAGAIFVADYCRQDEWPMRQLFRLVQALDGKANTQANADGVVERLLGEVSGMPVVAQTVVRSPTGAISLFRLSKAGNEPLLG